MFNTEIPNQGQVFNKHPVLFPFQTGTSHKTNPTSEKACVYLTDYSFSGYGEVPVRNQRMELSVINSG
jgi:hypothetical protein